MKKIFFILSRYFAFLVLIPTIILDVKIADKMYINETPDIIISVLLPMIFTILVIAISLMQLELLSEK